MRKIVMTCAAAAALFVAAAFTAPLAQAMTSAVPVDLVKAAAGANLTENVGYICHWRFRQCWWFPPTICLMQHTGITGHTGIGTTGDIDTAADDNPVCGITFQPQVGKRRRCLWRGTATVRSSGKISLVSG